MTPEQYAEALTAAGFPEREVARAFLYATHFGMEAMEGSTPEAHMVFETPSCENWNCLNPEHQTLTETYDSDIDH